MIKAMPAVESSSAPRDIGWAIRTLSDADLLRLRALASLRARGLVGGITWSDLLHEAIVRALDGSRHWPPNVPLVAFLAGIMRSLRDEHWQRARREVRMAATAGEATQAADPERVYAATQTLAAIDRLFADDAIALKIVAGLAHGLAADEIRRLYGLSETEYDTARRRIRRALLRHGLTGTDR
jgi:RNA polymerase sigma-70 factor (ECF subfamily)